MINIIIKYILIYFNNVNNKLNLIKKPGNGGIPAKFKKKNKLNMIKIDSLFALLFELFKLINWNELNKRNEMVVTTE